MRRILRKVLHRVKAWVDADDGMGRELIQDIPFDNRYPWICASFKKLMQDPVCAKKPHYIWGVLQGVALGKVLGIQEVSVLELGVAGGNGLVALEHIAERCQDLMDIRIQVHGFDTGRHIPKPKDYRDCPSLWREGMFVPDLDAIRARLHHAQLHLGLVEETVTAFLASAPPPIAFVASDLCLYSSTKSGFKLLEAEKARVLPRVTYFFEDIMGECFSEHTGARLAIQEFNADHQATKVAPIHGLRYFVPAESRHLIYWDMFYSAHFFDHPLYAVPQALYRPGAQDVDGKYFLVSMQSKGIPGNLEKIKEADPRYAPSNPR